MKKLLVAVMGLGLIALTAAPAAAQESPTGAGLTTDVQPAVFLSDKKQTKVTIDHAVTGIANLPAGTYAAIDGLKVLNCGTTTCIISAEISVQLGPSDPANAADCPIAYRFVVDSVEQSASGLFAGVIDGAQNAFYFENINQVITSGSLAPGNHTVQTFVATFGTGVCAARNRHHVTYRQYKP